MLLDSNSFPSSMTARDFLYRALVEGNAEEVSLELSCGVGIPIGIETWDYLLLPDHLDSIEFLI